MSNLGAMLRELKRETGTSLADLTVLSAVNDPFRLDTETFHIAGRWFRDQMQVCGLLGRPRPIHNRGVHYAIVARGNVLKPDGSPYINDADSWAFLELRASKAARWLGYIPFEQIEDARNTPPIIRVSEMPAPSACIRIEADWYLPDADALEPRVDVTGFEARQTHKVVFFGEKTSLADVLSPLAEEYDADLYLPSGEISDTLLARMARSGAIDGREMVVLVLADCDPAGYQMAVSIGHKLRALRESLYASLAFRVLTPALTVKQVVQLDLPSSPLKETELRAAGWREKHGVEQTEIDALATLRPDVLREIVEETIEPYFNLSLKRRVAMAKRKWMETAQAAFDQQVNHDFLQDLRDRAESQSTPFAMACGRSRPRSMQSISIYRHSPSPSRCSIEQRPTRWSAPICNCKRPFASYASGKLRGRGMMASLTLPEIDALTGGKLGTFDLPCPECRAGRRSPQNRKRPVLRIWRTEPGFASYLCARCGLKGYARDGSASAAKPERLHKAEPRSKHGSARKQPSSCARPFTFGRAGNPPKVHPSCPTCAMCAATAARSRPASVICRRPSPSITRP